MTRKPKMYIQAKPIKPRAWYYLYWVSEVVRMVVRNIARSLMRWQSYPSQAEVTLRSLKNTITNHHTTRKKENEMKKLFAIAMVLVILASLTACSTPTTHTDEEVSLVITDLSKTQYYSTLTAVKGWQYTVKFTVYCEELDFEDTISILHTPGMGMPKEFMYSEGDTLKGTLRTEFDENGTVVSQNIIGTHK